MLVWINGPSGVGKTATAFELHRRLPGSAVCDPGHVGLGMRRMLPASLRGNFQDIPTWRHAVRELLGRPEFAEQVYTDRKSVAEVADTIASSAGLAITPSADGPLRAWLRRYATTMRNIHWN
ncbi:MAG TPA: hypothetical protein VFE26_05505 [Trebonia sp.]|jgi:hypothetical protein|nr:hypothetical protein [Trebonia sp.]